MSKERARQLRKSMSPPEIALWFRLRELKREGWHFRRQSVEAPYVLDFVCRAAKLVVEVDGAQHAAAAQSQHDAERDRELAARGYRVLRFWASDVQSEMDGVVETVLNALREAGSPTRRATRDTLPETGRDKIGVRYGGVVRLGLRKRTEDS